MSRQIYGLSHKLNDEFQYKDIGKLLITSLRGKTGSFLISDNRLVEVDFFSTKQSHIGAVYLGKVKNVCPNIDACFVEIKEKELVYLPFSQGKSPFILNRKYDGRILEGDELLVQIERDAQKTKQASVTTNIKIQGRYAGFSIASDPKLTISAKLSEEQKETIQKYLFEKGFIDGNLNFRQNSFFSGMKVFYNVVIRTEAYELIENDKADKLISELAALESQFIHVFEKAQHSTCFACLTSLKKNWETTLDTISFSEYEEVVTDDPKLYKDILPYFQKQNKPVRLYTDQTYPLKTIYGLESKIDDALSRRIWLKSGAYLVVDTTEALTVFDVNSGKYDVKKACDESFYQINLEAAKEIALQIRLRNISGIILVDFINMKNVKFREKLLCYMKELTKSDPLRTVVVDITPLGLMEITRKKANKTLAEELHDQT